MKDWTYIEAMMEVTPLFDRQLHQENSHLMRAEMPYARRKSIRSFLIYLVQEDERYALIPSHAMYEGQQGLKGIIEQEISRLGMPVRTTGPSRFGRPFGKVATWFTEKGYGFVTPDGTINNDAFVHAATSLSIRANMCRWAQCSNSTWCRVRIVE